MSMLNIAKKLKRLPKSKLTEAKADTQRLIDFAGQDLADRFLKIKDKLKSPENDLYYWIKNKTAAELELAVANIENTKSNSATKKEISERGAQLVCDSTHWKVYHITTFEAAQKYGRDSQWCITGVNDYGDRYWKQYTDDGVSFYFAINKEDYNPRGTDSKFAFAVYPGGVPIELYNQVDDRSSLEDMPYYSEISIPGVDLRNVTEDDYDDGAGYTCDLCGCEIEEGEEYITPDGEYYCEDCWEENFFECSKCGETNSREDAIITVFGEPLCATCWFEFMDSDKGNAQSFADWSFDGIESFFGEINTENEKRKVEKELHAFATCWFAAKNADALNYTAKEMAEIEQALFDDAAALGLDFKKERYVQNRDYSYLDNPMDTGYIISVDGSSKRAENHSINVEQALEEILAFINSLSDEEKPRVRSDWRCASDGYDPEREDFMDGYEGELIVNIYSDAEQEDGLWDSEEERIQEKTAANYDEADDKIRAALGLPKKVYESLGSKKRITESLSVIDEFRVYEKLWD